MTDRNTNRDGTAVARAVSVYIRAQAHQHWGATAFAVAFARGLQPQPRARPYVDRAEHCFDVDSERYAFQRALLTSHVVNGCEHWHFVSFPNRRLTRMGCMLLNALRIRKNDVAQIHLPFDPADPSVLRKAVAARLATTRIIWLDGTADRSPPWAQVSSHVAAAVPTFCYPVNYHPWRFADVMDGRYACYLYDEKWQGDQLRAHCGWATSERIHELTKIPNYVSVFRPRPHPKRWDICLPGMIKQGKNQELVIEAAARTAWPKKLRILLVGDGMQGQSEHYARVRAAVDMASGLDITVRPSVSRHRLAEFMAASGIVVAAAKWDTAPRIVQEALCCGTPVLMNEEMLCGGKYITPHTGRRAPLSRFHVAMAQMLTDADTFTPRQAFLDQANPEGTLNAFLRATRTAIATHASQGQRVQTAADAGKVRT